MLNILALYRGKTLADVRTIAVTSDNQIIADFTDRLIKQKIPYDGDKARISLNKGVKNTLKIIRDDLKGNSLY